MNRTFSALFKTVKNLLNAQKALENVLFMYFSIHREREYYQGFNDVSAVLLLCFGNTSECLYYLNKIAEKYFKNFVTDNSFQYELMRVVSSIESMLKLHAPFKIEIELIKVITYSFFIS